MLVKFLTSNSSHIQIWIYLVQHKASAGICVIWRLLFWSAPISYVRQSTLPTTVDSLRRVLVYISPRGSYQSVITPKKNRSPRKIGSFEGYLYRRTAWTRLSGPTPDDPLVLMQSTDLRVSSQFDPSILRSRSIKPCHPRGCQSRSRTLFLIIAPKLE